ncbi:MAG: AMP-binding protein [Rhodospirillales bacterium]|jgi:2,3-dihydroxybenzoate-AMP ligase|nr:AMP-binding protein [Rhodospirillales bacterium]MDP6642757.1 AMP-binding protein [Rhodospirillales bacterium]MDP6841511.1 AMP-binding protein [Rhodospirillales bacterium]|tara:strand:- start:695 stop:2344 length:1650 start_codon:yes stop_codon:yes gene_type:complete
MLDGCTPWPEEFAKRYREAGYWEDISLWRMLEQTIQRFGSKEALIYGTERITYRQMGETIERLADGFSGLGLKPLDRVVFQLPNIPEFVYAFFALMKIGVIPVMALPAHRRAEIGHFIRHAGATGYLIPDIFHKFDYRDLADEMHDALAPPGLVIVAGEAGENQVSIGDLLAAPEGRQDATEDFRPDPCEVALMLLSGGTTGLPKMIPRTHNDYVYNSRQCGVHGNISGETVFLALLPMAHNYNLACPGILTTFACGGRVVISPDTELKQVLALVERERVTIIPAAVPLITRWLNSPLPGQIDISSLEVMMNGGAKLAPEFRKRVQDVFDCAFQESFGTGEGLINVTRLDDEPDLILHSSGKPISPGDEIKVVDDAGNEVPDGEVGELICRGPYTIRGYYKAPEINAEAFTGDGFYRMGDLVSRESGYVYVRGRIKDLINRGGEKISIDEVENLILANEKIVNVCLVAMPDEEFGEKACAFVIAKANQAISFDELKEFLLARGIAKFKLPERLEVVESFPLSPAGKILRRDLRAVIETKLAAEKVSTSA